MIRVRILAVGRPCALASGLAAHAHAAVSFADLPLEDALTPDGRTLALNASGVRP